MITCFLRYWITPGKEREFEEYGRRWTALITRYGGTHLGYFVPDEAPDLASARHFSFPGVGREGEAGVGICLYSFPDLVAYNEYRRRAAEDPEARAAGALFENERCFSAYERSFVRPLS